MPVDSNDLDAGRVFIMLAKLFLKQAVPDTGKVVPEAGIPDAGKVFPEAVLPDAGRVVPKADRV